MQVTAKKTCEFRLELNEEEKKEWDNQFFQYSRAVNNYLKFIINIRDNYRSLFGRGVFSGKCIVCGETKKIEFVSKDGFEKFCRKCYYLNFGDQTVRKKFYPVKGKRKIEDKLNVKNYASLTNTEFDQAYRDAIAILRSRTKKDRSNDRLIKSISNWINKFVEIRDNPKKRLKKPREQRERVDRFCHVDDLKRKNIRYYTMSEVNSIIDTKKRQVKNIEKRKNTFPKFKGFSRTQKKQFINFKDDKIKIKIGNKWYSFEVIGDYQKEHFEKIKNQEICYPNIIKKREKYYLDYPIKEVVNLPEPNSNFKAMGIDRGVKKIIVSSIIDSKNSKPTNVVFIDGKHMMHRKKVYQEMRNAFFKQRHSLRKIRRTKGKIKNYTKYFIHNISRSIVNQAKDNKPIVIVLEDIKHIRDTARKGKSKEIKKKENIILTNFLFALLQEHIIYKALFEGIPVAMVDPRLTSQVCNKCGYSDPRNRKGSDFKCLECGYMANADFNASVNIARRYYENLETSTIEFDEKGNIFKFVQPIS